MKNLFLVFIAVLGLTVFNSCEKNNESSDQLLIEEIATSQNKVSIAPEDLPQSSKEYVDAYYFDTYVETTYFVENKGYEVVLGEEENLYFNKNGEHMDGMHRPHRPCARLGQPLPVEELPQTITDYIAENYPELEARRAKTKGEKIIVMLKRHFLLVFDMDGNFITEAHLFHHCRVGISMDLENLPAGITDYISENHTEAEIKKAVKLGEKIVVGLLNGDERIVLVFDLDGNFLFQRV